ncbi:MAG: zinc-binding dehydrogenase [Actinobacteria bacterium]|nr:zinc-binding dehydrogenase [Actinomycetota bacterium]
MRALQLDFAEVPPLALHEVEPPPLPGDGWARLRPRLTGICGSDVGLLSLHQSMYLAPYMDLPATLGHEILADDEDGRRVVVDTVLGCEALGRTGDEACPPCVAGFPEVCRRFGEDQGALIGFSAGVGGGWSEELVAPRANLFPVPEDLPDERAVLLEPAAVMLHAVLLRPIRSPALVVGAGLLGLSGAAVLRALDPSVEVVVLAKHEHQARAAEEAGATAVRLREDGGHNERLAELSGARLAGPSIDRPTVTGGFPVVLECVGNDAAVDLSFRMAEERGTVVLVGGSAYARELDLAPTWSRELEIVGSYCYGWERWEGERIRTFDLVLDLVRDGRLRPGEWVTHTFGLEEHPAALAAAMSKSGGALKVCFRP